MGSYARFVTYQLDQPTSERPRKAVSSSKPHDVNFQTQNQGVRLEEVRAWEAWHATKPWLRQRGF